MAAGESTRNGRPVFTYEEALETFPQVEALTAAAVSQIEALLNRVQSREEMARRRSEIDEAVVAIIEHWSAEVGALGCEVKGPWLIDWDSGSGYYCWRYPEESIGHFHGYEDGFAGRVPIN